MPDLSTPIPYQYGDTHVFAARWAPEGWTAKELAQSKLHFLHTRPIAEHMGLDKTIKLLQNVTERHAQLQSQPDTPPILVQQYALRKIFFEARIREIQEYIATNPV